MHLQKNKKETQLITKYKNHQLANAGAGKHAAFAMHNNSTQTQMVTGLT